MLLDMIQQQELFLWFEVIMVEMKKFILCNIVYEIFIIKDDNDSGIHINMLNGQLKFNHRMEVQHLEIQWKQR
jgi:hypothetical protein